MSRKIRLGNKTYDSLESASKALNLKSSSGLKQAIYAGKTEYHGMTLQVVRPRKMSSSVKFCPVYCENLQRKFKTITLAAKFAGVNDWTMSKKMTASGKFIDDKGNVYKRLKPMKTKNIYEDTGSTMKIRMPKNITRKTNEEKTLDNLNLFSASIKQNEMKRQMEVQEKKEVKEEVKVEMKIDKSSIAKEVLKVKMKELIDVEKFDDMKAVMQVYNMIQGE